MASSDSDKNSILEDEDDLDRTGICEELEDYIAERPFKALAVSFFVGLVLGRLVL